MIPTNRPSRIKPGIYQVRVKEVNAEGVGPSGYPTIKLVYDILLSNGKPSGRELRDNLSLSPKALFRVDSFMDAAGVEEGEDMEPRQLKGLGLWVRVEDQVYQGAKQAKVTAYLTESAMQNITPSSVEEMAYVEPSNGQPRPFAPSNPLEDEEEEGEETLSSILEEEGEGEDIPF
jgi:hypothetical protein